MPASRPGHPQGWKATRSWWYWGIDAHKRTHTVVAVDAAGRQSGVRVTQATSTAAHLDVVRWAGQFGPDRSWAVEDCRHLSRRLEAALLAAGEVIVRVPPKLMAGTRKSAPHPPAQAYLKHRMAAGDTKTEALRALKRRLSDTIYRALLADGQTVSVSQAA